MKDHSTRTDMPVLSPSDIIIAVMGITGSGKSTFISLLLDGDDVAVGHGLQSCTTDVRAHSFIYKNTRRVFLVDTPGFDDTYRSDTDVLKDVAFFLSQTYKQSIRLAGIIYLHRITDNRMQGSSLKNLSMFKKLCGENAFEHIALVSTMWDDLRSQKRTFDYGEEREKELLTNPDWWGFMKSRGSKVFRHTGETESALAIVSTLVKQAATVILDIQREMVDEHLLLEDTAAGKQVEEELQKAKEKFKETIRDIEEEHQKALKARDDDLANVLIKQRHEYEDKLKKATANQQDLKWNLERLEKEKQAEISKLYKDLERQEQQLEKDRAEHKAELKRIETERQQNEEKHHKTQTEFAESIKAYREKVSQMEHENKTNEAKRAKQEAERLEKLRQELQSRFDVESAKMSEKEQELQMQFEQLQVQNQNLQERKSSTRFILPLLGLMTSILGAVTMNPAAMAAGVGMMETGAGIM